MYIAKVMGTIQSTIKHETYEKKKIMIIQPLDINFKPKGSSCVAVDYVDAGEGDFVIAGSAPGAAKLVFNLEKAPIRTLIMGIIDTMDVDNKTVYDKSK